MAVGLSESYVGKVESGVLEPSFRAFSKIAVGLNMSPGEMFILATQEANRG